MSNQRRGPMGGHGRMGSGEKAKDFKGTLKRVLKYIGPYKFPILCYALCCRQHDFQYYRAESAR